MSEYSGLFLKSKTLPPRKEEGWDWGTLSGVSLTSGIVPLLPIEQRIGGLLFSVAGILFQQVVLLDFGTRDG